MLGAAELIDPRPSRQLATIDTRSGRHTFPLENGEPLVLDPAFTRNTLVGGLFQQSPGGIVVTPNDRLEY